MTVSVIGGTGTVIRTIYNVDRVEDSASNWTIRMQFSDEPIVLPIQRKLLIERG